MPGGRPPKPTEQRIREGNPGKRPLPAKVQLSAAQGVVAPEGMDKDALACWEMVVPTLRASGMLDGVDTAALEAMCIQYARAKKASRVIEKQGMFAKGSTGQMVEHPAVKTERDAHAQFLRYATEFGLTLLARTRLGLAELHRQTMAQEIDADLGKPKLSRVK